ncbi:unnamed protein product [marine sediment metagenome]|uniref:Uncharacterized protein n=1 Tax=marine sediment metagenome TaxID=412755 RepID=X0U6Z8_9ZZZZ
MNEKIIECKQLGIDVAREYEYLWNTFKKAFPIATDEDVAKMVSITTGVCHDCYEWKSGCQCWNDE